MVPVYQPSGQLPSNRNKCFWEDVALWHQFAVLFTYTRWSESSPQGTVTVCFAGYLSLTARTLADKAFHQSCTPFFCDQGPVGFPRNICTIFMDIGNLSSQKKKQKKHRLKFYFYSGLMLAGDFQAIRPRR